jgi:zinc protease
MTTICLFRRSPRAAVPAPVVRSMVVILAGVALLLLGSTATFAAGDRIVDRPEQLQYPPLSFTPPDAGQYRVMLDDGMAAYLVPDKTLPMVTVTVLMRIGPDLDPPGQEGLAAATVNLLTRSGTAGMTADQLEERVAFLGAQLESGMGSGRGMMGMGGVPISGTESRVTLNLLSKDLDEGLKLLTDCIKGCAFQEDRLTLRRDQQLQEIKRRNDESAGIEEYEWNYLTNGEGHWSTRYPTEASLKAITREQMVAFQRRYMGPKNFVLAVSGDFDKAAMVKRLRAAFAGWPTKGENPGPPAAPVAPVRGGWSIAEKEVNQTRVSFGIRTIDRYDPDHYAAQVMNFILGGGGFTSRLVNRIRSDEGLAYSVSSRFEGGFYYPDLWRVSFQTKARSTAFATQIALTEINRMRDDLVSDQELETAKNSFIEGFPARFPNAAGVAGTLAAEELTGRWQKDPRYLAEYTQRMKKVSAQDVQRVARRLLDPQKMVFLLVGDGKEMVQADGKHEITLTQLAGGEPGRIPLRDPLTMKPLP